MNSFRGTFLAVLVMTIPSKIAWPSEEELPSLEMLEFLAEWETDDGEWIDPIALYTEPDNATSDSQYKGNETKRP